MLSEKENSSHRMKNEDLCDGGDNITKSKDIGERMGCGQGAPTNT